MPWSHTSRCECLLRGGDPLNTQLETVNTTTIDAAFGGDKIAFLKIDAEGGTKRVLRGAARLLSLGRIPPFIGRATQCRTRSTIACEAT